MSFFHSQTTFDALFFEAKLNLVSGVVFEMLAFSLLLNSLPVKKHEIAKAHEKLFAGTWW